jgi:uncharacterized protein YndB with AHSA1/START domain
MSVTSVEKDVEGFTLLLVADYDVPPTRVWELWADPRQLERWWGPPTHPATVERHDLTPGGKVTYFMTGPEGEKYHGWWGVDSVDPPGSLEFKDGFADQDGAPIDDMPNSTVHVRLTEHDGGTRMELRSTFPSQEQMEKLVEIGMVEGLREAVGQMDMLLMD